MTHGASRTEGEAAAETLLGVDRQVIALGIARAADAVANSFLIIVLPLYIASGRVTGRNLGLSPEAITGIVLAIFGVFNSGIQPFAGRLSDRLGKRRIFVLVGLVGLAATNLLYVAAGSYLSLLLIRSAQGAAVALTITASIALVNEVSPPERRGGNMGVFNALRLVGFGTGPLAAGLVVEGGPYRLPGAVVLSGFDAVFWLAAAGAALSALLVLLLVRDPPRPTAKVGRIALSLRARTPGRTLDPIFALGLATLFMAACISVLAPIEMRVNERLGQGPTLFGVQFAVFILSLAVTQPFVGKATDRWGRKRFLVAGLLLLVPTTLVQGLVTTPGGMIAARLAQGIAGSLTFAPALALAGDLATGGQSGVQLSVLTVAFGLGLSVGQLGAGFLVELGYLVPFAFGAALALVGAWAVQTQVPPPGERAARAA